jgi:hypothetical protein
MKMCLVEGKFFHVDGQSDMTKLTAAFCNYENIPKNQLMHNGVHQDTLF